MKALLLPFLHQPSALLGPHSSVCLLRVGRAPQQTDMTVSPCWWMEPWSCFQSTLHWLNAANCCCAGRLGLAPSITRTLAALKLDGPLRCGAFMLPQSALGTSAACLPSLTQCFERRRARFSVEAYCFERPGHNSAERRYHWNSPVTLRGPGPVAMPDLGLVLA